MKWTIVFTSPGERNPAARNHAGGFWILFPSEKYQREIQLIIGIELVIVNHSLKQLSRYFCLDTKVTKRSMRRIRFGFIAGCSVDRSIDGPSRISQAPGTSPVRLIKTSPSPRSAIRLHESEAGLFFFRSMSYLKEKNFRLLISEGVYGGVNPAGIAGNSPPISHRDPFGVLAG